MQKKTILFSGYFDFSKNPEREQLFRNLSSALSARGDVEVILFNRAGRPVPVEKLDPMITQIAATDRELYKLTSAELKTRLKRSLRRAFKGSRQSRRWLRSSRYSLRSLYLDFIAEDSRFGTLNVEAIAPKIGHVEALISQMESERPSYCLLWNQFNGFHRFARRYCEAVGVPVAFFHDGVLPGSLSLDLDGEMGESWVSRTPEKSLEVTTSAEQLERAMSFLRDFCGSSPQRHQQVSMISLDAHFRRLPLNKPLILMLGQHDWNAGLLPADSSTHFHSPHYRSTRHALSEVYKAAQKIGAHVLFKSHPLDAFPYQYRMGWRDGLSIVHHCSLDEALELCDVAVTIASQACYLSLFAGKPTVLLGRNQLVDKGVTFDLKSPKGLPGLLTEALNSDPDSRSEALCRHMAQLSSTYLYDYGTLETEFFERDVGTLADELIHMVGTSDMAAA